MDIKRIKELAGLNENDFSSHREEEFYDKVSNILSKTRELKILIDEGTYSPRVQQELDTALKVIIDRFDDFVKVSGKKLR